MRFSLASAALAATASLTQAASIMRRDSSSLYVPPDLYDSPEPTYAGAPIVLSDPSTSSKQQPKSTKKWAMTYTPYTSTGSCKTASQVSSDISLIASKGFRAVRLYATDCLAPQNVGSAAAAHGLKMVLGIYISESGIASPLVAEQVRTIAQWGSSAPDNWGLVDMVVAGNEAIFNGFASASELATLVNQVRTTLSTYGYEGPVTTTEPLGTVAQNAPVLCSSLDILAANLHPFFHADLPADEAGDFVLEQLLFLSTVCEKYNGPSEVVAMEIGWPRKGSANGEAVPGPVEQKIAVGGMARSIGPRAAFTAFEDEEWRDEGDFGVENSWGCLDLF